VTTLGKWIIVAVTLHDRPRPDYHLNFMVARDRHDDNNKLRNWKNQVAIRGDSTLHEFMQAPAGMDTD